MCAEALISRLEGVRKTGADRWIARCPAHEDRSPSLTIKALSDGRTLLHCHASCDVREVMDAIGLPMSALFEERALQPGARLDRSRREARDALICLEFDVIFVGIIANDLAAGKAPEENDRARLWTAIGRIARAQELCHGPRDIQRLYDEKKRPHA